MIILGKNETIAQALTRNASLDERVNFGRTDNFTDYGINNERKTLPLIDSWYNEESLMDTSE